MDNTGQTEIISKKELLIRTGVSYGQLYRWKRERLIPDSWFIKKSSFTGQETFFPKEKILTRIKAILDMKDGHSLEEMAAIFSPVLSRRTISLSELRHVPRMNIEALIRIAALYGQDFTFSRALVCYMFSRIMDSWRLSDEDKDALYQSVLSWEDKLNVAHQAVIMERGGHVFMLLVPDGTQAWPDAVTRVVTYSLSELSRELRIHLPEEAE